MTEKAQLRQSGEWTLIHSTPSHLRPEDFWFTVTRWLEDFPYEQLYKITVNCIEIDGNQLMDLKADSLDVLGLANNGASIIKIRRTLYPKDYKRQKEMQDEVTFYCKLARSEYTPIFEDGVHNPDNIPHYYPKVHKWCWSLVPSDDLPVGPISEPFTYLPPVEIELTEEERKQEQSLSFKQPMQNPIARKKLLSMPPRAYLRFEAQLFDELLEDTHYIPKLQKIAQTNFTKLEKWGISNQFGGYKKRVHHDVIVSRDAYTYHYRRLKEKYQHWVTSWAEETDPQKHVFEDIGIAAYLIALWELEQKELQLTEKQTFVDIGAGNGFLVYILTMEGYKGFGVELRRRKSWAHYPPEVDLREEPIYPETASFQVDWIIANHADELTPWAPIIASNSNARIFSIPCCLWEFDRKYNGKKAGLSRYETYVEFIKQITATAGYEVETEHLRIPSTKNIAIISRQRTIDPNDPEQVAKVKENIAQLLAKRKFQKFTPRPPEKVHDGKHASRQNKAKRVATNGNNSTTEHQESSARTDTPT